MAVAGCAHSGIINIIKYAQKIMGAEGLYAVDRGFHLMNAGEDRIASKAKALQELDSEIVWPGHCTVTKVVALLRQVQGDRCLPLSAEISSILAGW